MSKLPASKQQLIFSVFTAGMMAFVMTFFITLINLGFAPDFFLRWMKAYGVAFVLAVPAIYLIAPIARRLTACVVESPKK